MHTQTGATQLTRRQIQDIGFGYSMLINDRLERGWSAYMMTLMFHQLRGGGRSVRFQQEEVIRGLYARHLTRVVRAPNAPSQRDRRPIWVCAPDRPVFKHDKQLASGNLINDGWHWHALVAQPPRNRLAIGLPDHFINEQDLYVGLRGIPGLARVEAVEIEDHGSYVTEYALFKQVLRRAVDLDAFLVLPRTSDEMTRDHVRPNNRGEPNC